MCQKLTPRQNKAITALMSSKNIGETAVQAGVSERTLYRWLSSPEFRTALLEAEGEAIDTAARRLIGNQSKALEEIEDVFRLADEQARVNIADFVSEEPKAITAGRGKEKQIYYIESGSLNWDEIRERGHLIKKISFNQYGPILELYDSQAAAILKLRTSQVVLDYLLKLRELRNLEARLAELEAAVYGQNKK